MDHIDKIKMDKLILRPSKKKYILVFLLFLLFSTIGIMMISSGAISGWFVASFGILGLIVSILAPSITSLLITPAGFTEKSLLRSTFYKWSDIKKFNTGRPGGLSMVTFEFSDSYKQNENARAFSKGFSGYETGLHDTYGMKAEDLTNLLNQRLQQYKTSPSKPT